VINPLAAHEIQYVEGGVEDREVTSDDEEFCYCGVSNSLRMYK